MANLRVEFVADVNDGVFPPSPIAAVSVPLSSTPTPADQQPTVPTGSTPRAEVFVRMRADRAAYVSIANRPVADGSSKSFLVVPGQSLLLRAYPGQRVAAATADDFATYTQAQVDALIAAALAAGHAPGAPSGTLDFSQPSNSGLLAAVAA